MSQHLAKNKPPSNAKLDQAKAKQADLEKELALEMAQIAADTAGLADPSPVSDGISAAISVARGDWWGAALSVVSMVPYAGDAVAKPIKAVRAAKSVQRIRRALATAKATTARLQRQAILARQKATTAVRRAKRAAAESKAKVKSRTYGQCPVNRFGTNIPTTGSWKGELGNSHWNPPKGSEAYQAIKKYDKRGTGVHFKNGYPDFSPFVEKHNGVPVKVEIPMQGYIQKTSKSGKLYKMSPDFKAANDAMKRLDPKWKQPENTTWHHVEDGKTMILVPTDVHKNTPHSGGGSLIGDEAF